MSDSPPLPPGWIWYRACLPDGRSHCFAHPADTPAAVLRTRAWQVWSPARAGRDGGFCAAGLTVAPRETSGLPDASPS